MKYTKEINVVLIGNPNTGKSTVFNKLTGLNQKVGNYPGVTVEKKEGFFNLENLKVNLTDLPGTYSLIPNSIDEHVVLDFVLNKDLKSRIDLVLFIADVENIQRTMLLFSQIKDLGLPAVLVINMSDRIEANGLSIDAEVLATKLKTKVVLISAKKSIGLESLKDLIVNYEKVSIEPLVDLKQLDAHYFEKLDKFLPNENLYVKWLRNIHSIWDNVTPSDEIVLDKLEKRHLQQKETILRHRFINEIIAKTITKKVTLAKDIRQKLDNIFLHRIFGLIIFFAILFVIFQSIFVWSAYPMDWIESGFGWLSNWTQSAIPPGVLNDLISEGIIPGLGGVAIFIPQIAFLFFFIAVLEESGYMSRVVFITDKIMRKFGLSGKSIVPLISGTACAIPAVMATRNIESWKERLITILVTPFITCSARLPVYLILISLIIPNVYVFGISYQAIVLLILYLIGFAVAIGSAAVLNKVLKIERKADFVIEMPNYKFPIGRSVFSSVIESTKSFVVGAGKIIVALSIIIWFLASHGYSDNFQNAEQIVHEENIGNQISELDLQRKVSSFKIENSYIGSFSKALEPAIAPLGYDWKIGIALISSFAAREVFVGTLATIYSVGEDQHDTIKNKMSREVRKDGKPRYDFATGISLLLFYAFALQCMSTIAVVKKETNGWKWPMIQLVFMTGFAYLAALIAYQILK